jgi:hypothetical protein
VRWKVSCLRTRRADLASTHKMTALQGGESAKIEAELVVIRTASGSLHTRDTART